MFDALLRWLLRAGPEGFRERYGAEIVKLAEERLRHESLVKRPWRAVKELIDLARTVYRERHRENGPTPSFLASAADDGRAAVRGLLRRRKSSLAIVAVLTIGIGAAVLGFSVMSTVVLRPLPYGAANRLVFLWGAAPPTVPNFNDEQPLHGRRVAEMQLVTRSMSAIDGFKADVFNLDAANATPERIDGLLTTSGLFNTMQVTPAAGRFFVTGEDVAGAPCTAVIGFGLWQRVFAGRPTAVNSVVRLNERACTIVGVAPRGFEFPRGGEMPATFQYATRTEIWVASPLPTKGPSDLTVLARLSPVATLASAQAEMNAQEAVRDQQVRGSKGWNRVNVVPLRHQVVPSAIEVTVGAVFAAVGLLLVVAAGNAAQLFVVEGLRRRTEFAARAALGASPGRLARLAAFEAGSATGVAAILGTLLAAAGLSVIRAIGPARFPRLSELSLDGRAVLFALAAAVVATALVSVAPVLLARSVSLGWELRDRARGSSGALRRVRRALIAIQVTFAVVLVVASSLLLRSFISRLRVDPGFRADHTLVFEVTLPPDRFPEVLRGAMPATRTEILLTVDTLLNRLRAVPGVLAAATGKPLPMSGAQEASGIAVDVRPAPRAPGDVYIAEYIVASEDFFRTLGTPVLDGREFSAADREDGQWVTVVNQTMATQLWKGESAIGHRVKLGGNPASPAPWLTVIGVVPDMKRFGLDDAPGPVMYVHYKQGPYPSLATVPFIVRTASDDPLSMMPAIRAAAREAGLDVPVAAPQTMTDLVARTSADARFAMALMVSFALAALLLASAGLYGAVAFTVSERRQELGIRAALGAGASQQVRLVLRDGFVPAIAGGMAGIVVAVVTGQLLRSLLFGVSPLDPVSMILAPLGAVVLVASACVGPAVSASRVDPRETLRS